MVLPGPGVTPAPAGTCIIRFTVDVLERPTKDVSTAAGVQTVALGDHTATSTGNVQVPGAGTDLPRTIRAQPAISTVATATASIGGTITDQATVTGLVNAGSGPAITFNLYGPSQTTCTGLPLFTSTIPLSLLGSTGTATSAGYAPTANGTYRWVATYAGDANNAPVTGLCNEPGEKLGGPTAGGRPAAPATAAPTGCPAAATAAASSPAVHAAAGSGTGWRDAVRRTGGLHAASGSCADRRQAVRSRDSQP